MKIVVAIVEIVGLAEGIIDDTCLVLFGLKEKEVQGRVKTLLSMAFDFEGFKISRYHYLS